MKSVSPRIVFSTSLPVAGAAAAEALPAILLFGSGLSALVFQVLWVKQVGLIVGVDIYAVATVISGFFAGLALGGACLGRLGDRVARPLSLYAAIELGTAVLGVAVTLIFARSGSNLDAIRHASGPWGWLLSGFLISLPAFLMGGTLPVLIGAVGSGDRVGRVSGFLYAANTGGAIVGTLATLLVFVPLFGVKGTAWAAAGLNVIVGLAAVAVSRSVERAHKRVFAPAVPLRRSAVTAMALYALAGGVALGYEVVWSQAIVQFLSTRAHAFTVVLATYLIGLMAGSALYARFADKTRDPWMAFGLLVAAAGTCTIVLFASLGTWLPSAQAHLGAAVLVSTGSETLMMYARFAVAAAALILPPCILLGAAFPAAVRLVGSAGATGKHVGLVAGLNIAGGVAGTLITGFVLVPALGLVRAVGVLAVAASLIGFIAILRSNRRHGMGLGAVLLLGLVTGLQTALVPHDSLARLLITTRAGTLDFYEESPGGTVAVVEQQSSRGTFRRLYVQGVSNSGDVLPSLRYMRLQALLPLLIHRGEPTSTLVVGLGTGITCGAFLAYSSLERRVCVELLPAVVRAVPRFAGNYGAATDPRITLRIADGRHELLRNPDRYDVITLEPPPPSALGVVNLYSREFYELCRARLKASGLMAQWWPLAPQNDENSRSLVRSMLDVFPHVTVWTTELHEMLLIGSMEPIELDSGRIAARFRQPGVAAALNETGIASPAALLATYVSDRAGIERYVADAPPVTDDRPLIESARWVRRGEFARVLPRVLATRSEPPLINADETLRSFVAVERQRLFAFYDAALAQYTGDSERAMVGLKGVLREDAANPYFRWFLAAGRE